MAFTVSAREGEQIVSSTRLKPASAILLACRWAEKGRKDVRIVWQDEEYSIESFRSAFCVTIKGMRQRCKATI